jgi:hypothetical protein
MAMSDYDDTAAMRSADDALWSRVCADPGEPIRPARPIPLAWNDYADSRYAGHKLTKLFAEDGDPELDLSKSHKKLTPAQARERRQRIKAMFESGLTYEEIASRESMGATNVRRVLGHTEWGALTA